MAGTFRFELVSPERVLLSVDADQVVVPETMAISPSLPDTLP